jgi:hypothetical protein
MGRPGEEAVVYARTAIELENDPRYQPFNHGWSHAQEALAHLNAGRVDRWLEINAALADETGFAHLVGRCGLTWMLPAAGRAAEARAIADGTLATARAHGNPFVVAYALSAYGEAFAETDPNRALDALREGLAYSQEHRLAGLAQLVDHLRAELGQARFDELVAAGAAMEFGDAVRYAHDQIQLTRLQLDEGHITHIAKDPLSD